MIGQYLQNNNETDTVAFRQKFYQLNSPLLLWLAWFHSADPVRRSASQLLIIEHPLTLISKNSMGMFGLHLLKFSYLN
jgi:hypothetical protein